MQAFCNSCSDFHMEKTEEHTPSSNELTTELFSSVTICPVSNDETHTKALFSWAWT